MRRLLAIPLATAGLGAGAAFAAAPVPTKLDIAYSHSSTSFGGRLRSPVAACRSARKVSVYLKGGGRLGSAVSDAAGRWRVYPSQSFAVGDYYATTPAITRGTAACARARSLTTRAS